MAVALCAALGGLGYLLRQQTNFAAVPEGEMMSIGTVVKSTAVKQVKRGEFIVIVGLSGSGKSMLMNMIGFLDLPDSGTCLLDGGDVSRMSDHRLAGVRN